MAHSSPDASALDILLSQSAGGMRDEHGSLTCCCGQDQCAYLQKNDVVLKGLESDLQTAAQIGQALLARHEAYIAESEAERHRMGDSVEALESQKRELETSNAQKIKENRQLLDELERVNGTVTAAENEILSLRNTLEATLQEVERLNALAARAARLEKQMSSLESEHATVQEQLASKEVTETSANKRWRRAESTVKALQDQLDRMEQEATEEQEKHAEILSRFERRRRVEKTLDHAAGRLKGAAAAKSLEESKERSVVTEFVQEVLQDNANLQHGILELRDMLMGSNEEVQNLREQMMLHQPMAPNSDKPGPLDDELSKAAGKDTKPDLHVHHHYHAAPNMARAEKSAATRRPKKRRGTASNTIFNSSSGVQTPRPSMGHRSIPSSSSTSKTILSQTSVTIPQVSSHHSHTHKWSMSQAPSSTAASSLPSSPMFERGDEINDSSRPTTPGSSSMGSPSYTPRHTKRDSDVSGIYGLDTPTFGTTEPQSIASVLNAPEKGKTNRFDLEEPNFPLLDESIIPEEPEDELSTLHSSHATIKPQNEGHDAFNPSMAVRPGLHRASSHESLLSIHGLDMPKLRSTPSARLLSKPSRPSLGSPTGSSGPVASGTWAVAHRSKSIRRYDSTSHYSKLLLASQKVSTSPTALSGAEAGSSPPSNTDEKGFALGRRVGGWIAGKWGIAPDLTTLVAGTATSHPHPQPANPEPENGPVTTPRKKKAKQQKEDEVGGGESGDKRTSTHIEPDNIDANLLQDSLGEMMAATGSSPSGGQPIGPTKNAKTETTAVPGAGAEEERVGKKEKKERFETAPLRHFSLTKGVVDKSDNRHTTKMEVVDVDDQLLADALGE